MDIPAADEAMTTTMNIDMTSADTVVQETDETSMDVDDVENDDSSSPKPKLDDTETDSATTSSDTTKDSTANSNMETSSGEDSNSAPLTSVTPKVDASSNPKSNANIHHNNHPPVQPPVPQQELMVVSMVPEEEAQMLIEMLRADDVADRVAAAHRLTDVASAIGPERAREELLPFLSESVDDEDEVLIALAESVGQMVPFVGGNSHAHHLLSLLEMLLTSEESTVRDKAILSTNAIATVLPEGDFNAHYVEMISRLATKEWFTARMSSCNLLATSFPRLTVLKRASHVTLYANLCRDDAPMVRRVAAQNLSLLFRGVVSAYGLEALKDGGVVPSVIVPLYEELATNEQDSIRLHTSESCVTFGRETVPFVASASEEDREGMSIMLKERILPLLIATVDDRAWRVRWTAASKFAEALAAYEDFDGAVQALIPAYEKLLQDPEAEVRTAAVFNVAAVAQCKVYVPSLEESDQVCSIAERLIKCVTALTDDDSEHVRAALAAVATGLAPLLGKEDTISLLLPPLLLLLRDSASEVRLNLISTLSSLNEVIGVNLLSQSLLPAILDLAEDSKWRIRGVIIQHIPPLAKEFGQAFVSEKLAPLCVRLLEDDISSIRQAAASNLAELTSLFGADWAAAHLLPPIEKVLKDPSYLRRLTAIQACAAIASVMDTDAASRIVLPLILDCAQDYVPNIRFNVAKALSVVAPKCTRAACADIISTLQTLVEDSDRDVRYFAKQSLDSLQSDKVRH
mmetsp:Transcript_14633/g.22608  ORF Transcript_14633/g.22608 Transcript_14633/m.22608 type:complete len:745 (+) Transcript_14633:114-2348(+)